MLNLAILGHATRGKEVIEILEMLGGKNVFKYTGYEHLWFTITRGDNIDWTTKKNGSFFNLEDFLEKFPYKTWDKVIVEGYEQVFEILSMRWCSERHAVMYSVSTGWYYAEELRPYKEETNLVTEEEYKKALEVEQEYMDVAERLMNQLAEGTHWKCENFDAQKMIAKFLKKHVTMNLQKGDSIAIDIPTGYEFVGVDDNARQVIFEKIKV